jgi:uncharacterized protein
MTVQVSEKDFPRSELAEYGAAYALEILKEQADSMPLIKQKACNLSASDSYPKVVNHMILCSQSLQDPDLTPLAAVAGAASDMVADYIAEIGATKIIVNNGGDIAIRLREGERATVGIRLNLMRPTYDYVAIIDRDCGLCTSGNGGRSFTLGVADGVAVLAFNAGMADVAATFLANRTTVNSPKVERVPAETIYPETDIPGLMVTKSVGFLHKDEIRSAINKGETEAMKLIEKNIIQGAVFSVKDFVKSVGYFKNHFKAKSR